MSKLNFEITANFTARNLRSQRAQGTQLEFHEKFEMVCRTVRKCADLGERELERLVSDMLQLSRLEAGKDTLEIEPLAVENLVRGSTETLRAACTEKEIALTIEIEPNLPPLHVDADRAYQALLNLLVNALEYTPANGAITLRAARHHHAIHIEVQDTGIGIAPEHIPHLFERFYRVDKNRSRAMGGTGIGIGLAVTRRILESHGGRVEAASHGIGKGSRFTLIFPLNRQPDSRSQ